MKINFSTPNIVQRIEKAPEWRKKQYIPFEKGLIKKGLSDEVGEVFQEIMSFEYMGSSEFEWGALPKSLEFAIIHANDNDYISAEIDIVGYKGNSKSVYYICHKDIEENVCMWLKKAGKGEHPRTQEAVRLNYVLNGDEIRTCGWYDFDNKFWFFTDRNMFLNVKKLFGV